VRDRDFVVLAVEGQGGIGFGDVFLDLAVDLPLDPLVLLDRGFADLQFAQLKRSVADDEETAQVLVFALDFRERLRAEGGIDSPAAVDARKGRVRGDLIARARQAVVRVRGGRSAEARGGEDGPGGQGGGKHDAGLGQRGAQGDLLAEHRHGPELGDDGGGDDGGDGDDDREDAFARIVPSAGNRAGADNLPGLGIDALVAVFGHEFSADPDAHRSAVRKPGGAENLPDVLPRRKRQFHPPHRKRLGAGDQTAAVYSQSR
jgi:hypothetical protein